MASEFTPAGFDTAAVLSGLRTAMGFGAPTRTEDRATFYLPPVDVDDTEVEDLHEVPFNPTVQRTATPIKLAVACAVEFFAGGQVIESFGVALADKIKVTLLDPEYQQVKGFLYVVAGGDKYIRAKTEPPVALGTIDVWTVWADAENER